MEYARFGNKIFARIDKGEELLEQLTEIVLAEGIALGSVSVIGAADRIRAGLFEPLTKSYRVNTFERDMEIVSCAGNITQKDGKPYLHIHIAAADKDGAVIGGHLNEARISLTGEAVIDIVFGVIERNFDGGIGLNLLKFEKK
ncbi:MAG: DNA-binding protein [Clostridiales bacterium]|jgi:predicted DNA-binding protein with PD1-like motif|nr:DNA-binding protein [Clostridiales bacterium]